MSNWFGNKRIRYKKNIGKAQEEASLYAAKAQHSTTPAVTASAGAMSASSATSSQGIVIFCFMYIHDSQIFDVCFKTMYRTP